LFLLFIINLLNYLDRYVLAGALSFIQKDLHLNDAEAGMLMTAFMCVYMFASPVFGWLGDRYPRKYLVASGILVWSLAATGAAFARNLYHLLICRALAGIGESSYATTAPTLIADISPLASRGKALSFFYVAIPIGSAMGFMLGGYVGQHYGWRNAFLLVGLPGIILAALMLTIREPERGQSDGIAASQNVAWSKALSAMWHNPSFVLITLGMAAMTFALGGLAYWMPTYLIRCRSLQPDTANFYFGAITVAAGFFGTFIGGWIGDWLQKRISGAYFLVCGVSMIVGAPFSLIALQSETPTIYWSAIFLAEFFLFLNTGPGNTIIANVISPGMRASAFAVNTLCIHLLGDACSPAIIGTLSETFAKHGQTPACSLCYSMYIMPVMMVLSGVIFLFGVPHLGRDTAKAQAGGQHDKQEKI
jgi:MFS family permease